jgi:cytochrome P450
MAIQTATQSRRAFDSVRNMMQFRKNPIAFMLDVATQHDDIAHVPFAAAKEGIYLILNPDYVHELLVKQPHKMVKWSRLRNAAGKVLGSHAMALLEGEPWRLNRRLSSPAFHIQRIENYIQMIARHTHEMLDTWDAGKVVDMDDAMVEVTTGIIGEILFDAKDFANSALELHDAFETLRYMLVIETTSPIPIPDWIPLPRKRREKAAIKVTDNTIKSLVQQRRASGEDRGDILSSLLQTVDEDNGVGMTDTEIRDSLMGLFIAGHETTAVLLTWLLYTLAKYPDIQEQVYQEVLSEWQADDVTYESLNNLQFMGQVIDETLRLYPSAWSLFMRETIEPIDLGTQIIPQGAVVLISPWILHRQANLWDNPHKFDPSRFDPDKASHHQYAYLPFGGGQRICVGNHLALMEVKVIIGAIIQEYEFELADPNKTDDIIPRFTVHPEGGMPIRLKKR